MRRTLLVTAGIILTALIASAIYMAGGFGALTGSRASFSMDRRAELDLNNGSAKVTFTTDVNGKYDIALFPGENCSITLSQLHCGSRLLGEGMDSLSAELVKGEKYTLSVWGAGTCTAELMRRSPGRSVARAALIRDGAAEGIIAREGNAGWYKFIGGDQLTTISVIPDAGLDLSLEALVYDGGGHLAAESVPLEGGACAVYFSPEPGDKYYLRVASPAGGKGMYSINIYSSGTDAVQSLDFATGDISVRAGDMRAARATVAPETAPSDLIWFTSDPQVATVNGRGFITAVGAGQATITAYAYGAVSHSITVSVAAVLPQDIMYSVKSVTVHMGDTYAPRLTVYPAAAADAGIVYSSSDSSVASVSETGEITAHAMGWAIITASYEELTARLEVTVDAAPARYRALMIGEQLYATDVNTVRTGSVNTVYNMESLLGTALYGDGVGCDVRVELDLSCDEAISAIRETFADSSADDVSILYITCHGSYRDGMSILQFCDGSELAASDLELELRKIPGTIVLLIDCCDSGGFVGTYSELSRFTDGIMTAFSGGQAPFAGSKYKILASAAINQDSYRLGYGDGEGDATTVFARALCDGLGWDIDAHIRSSLNADADYDGKITLWETYLYASRRVRYYLDIADGGTGSCLQDVQVYPRGDGFVLFER
jgi:hypothetical protein